MPSMIIAALALAQLLHGAAPEGDRMYLAPVRAAEGIDAGTTAVIEGAVLVAARQRDPAVVGSGDLAALLDLDAFRAVNERHGVATGDRVLRVFAQEAQAALRIVDRLGRWGGETFVLLLCDTRGPLARQGVERLRERVAAMQVPTASGEPVRVTVSAGMTEHHAGESIDQALSRARDALREAKTQGRNRLVVH